MLTSFHTITSLLNTLRPLGKFKVWGGGAVDTWHIPFSVDRCSTPSTLIHVNKPRGRVTREGVIINTSTHLNRTCRRLEVNIGKYCGGGKVQFNSDMKQNLTMGHLSVVIVQSSYHMLPYNLNYQAPCQIKDAVKPSTFRRSHLAHNGEWPALAHCVQSNRDGA